jgi:hypothetical protein
MATFRSLRKPLLAPSWETATSTPLESAARKPPAASLELKASRAAESARTAPVEDNINTLMRGSHPDGVVRIMSCLLAL